MILAILSLIENGKLSENRIEYSPQLLELFKRYFDLVKTEDDALNPILPFFHLLGDKFFHHKPFPGKQAIYEELSGLGSIKAFLNIVQYAYLDDALYHFLQDPNKLNELREVLIKKYFTKLTKEVWVLIKEEQEITTYETILKNGSDKISENSNDKKNRYRSAAFSRTIREIYDYRCSACGLRINLNGLVIIDAAHLIPFSKSYDDNPCNGIALCKNHHWAMDNFLLVPGKDKLWHVSPELDDRIAGCQDIISLNKRKVLLPQNQKFHPKEESLAWRHERILK
jgi:putative restriction endonuclease